MEKRRDFLICLDSDGCMFDTMDIKQKECFCPAGIEHFGLQPISRYAREAWEFVNLYSVWRGVHRLNALLKIMELLSLRKAVSLCGFTPPKMDHLRAYVMAADRLGNEGMRAYLSAHPDAEDVRKTIAWSEDVNGRIARMVHNIPPFPSAREGLELLAQRADVVVVSATPYEALAREWAEHDLTGLASEICGQERGMKREIIAAHKNFYAPDHVLMIGDAPGDRDAADFSGVLFYPIRPAEETESWRELPEAANAFFRGAYRGETQDAIVRRFEKLLPDTPPWEQIG